MADKLGKPNVSFNRSRRVDADFAERMVEIAKAV
jgi:hypothetical protein